MMAPLLDSAMNEEANFCSQCGSKINSDAKFCSNCGCDLQNSSTKITSDKALKVEVTNATIEKGFKAIGKGVKATGTLNTPGERCEDGAVDCGETYDTSILCSQLGSLMVPGCKGFADDGVDLGDKV